MIADETRSAALAPILFCASALGLSLSLLLGGGSQNGFASDAALQIAFIPLLAVSLLGLFQSGHNRHVKGGAWFCLALCCVPLLQLLPLPAHVWAALPARAPVNESYRILGVSPGSQPLTLSRQMTWLSLAALIVPATMFLLTSQLTLSYRRYLSLVLIGTGAIGVLLGLLQVAQGPSSPLRFFDFTNPTEAVGFFANRNHFAALLYSLFVLVAAWTVHAARANAGASRSVRLAMRTLAPLMLSLTMLVVLIGAQAMSRSRAGLGLTMLAMLAVFALTITDRKQGSDRFSRRLLGLAMVVATLFVVQFALYRIMERFESDPLADARVRFSLQTLSAAKEYAPFGSGLGSFVPVYAAREKSNDLLVNAYANHAHNDLAEIVLETAVVGILLLVVLLGWVIARAFSAWQSRSGERGGPPAAVMRGHDIDLKLTRAAGVVVFLIFVHSLVDYPLRTGAMMAVFAFSLGLLVPPPLDSADDRQHEAEEIRGQQNRGEARTRHRRPAEERGAAPEIASAPVAPRHYQPFAPAGLEWPDAWRKPARDDTDRSGHEGGDET